MNIQNIFDVGSKLTSKNPIYRSELDHFLINEIHRDLSPDGDKTSMCFKSYEATAKLVAKEEGYLCGILETEYICQEFGLTLKWNKKEGEKIGKEEIATIKGDFGCLMKVERTLLNVIQRMSGITSKTKEIIDGKFSTMADENGKLPILCPTRKTLLGILDKRAVSVGGGGTHRLNLSDAILIKENHIKNMGIQNALSLAWKNKTNDIRFFEIECETIEQAMVAAEFFNRNNEENALTVIMLDNFMPDIASDAIKIIRSISPDTGIELSGGINTSNISNYAGLGADIISMGCLTNDVKSLDISMKII